MRDLEIRIPATGAETVRTIRGAEAVQPVKMGWLGSEKRASNPILRSGDRGVNVGMKVGDPILYDFDEIVVETPPDGEDAAGELMLLRVYEDRENVMHVRSEREKSVPVPKDVDFVFESAGVASGGSSTLNYTSSGFEEVIAMSVRVLNDAAAPEYHAEAFFREDPSGVSLQVLERSGFLTGGVNYWGMADMQFDSPVLKKGNQIYADYQSLGGGGLEAELKLMLKRWQ